MCVCYYRYMVAMTWLIPFVMSLGWMVSVGMIVRSVVREKEVRMKETMKVMGLSRGQLWVSWFITSFFTIFISVSIITMMLKVRLSVCLSVCLSCHVYSTI